MAHGGSRSGNPSTAPAGRLAPLADVVAERRADPAVREGSRHRLTAQGYAVDEVGEWLVAFRALPGSRAAAGREPDAKLAFTEGADRAARAAGGFGRLGEAADGGRAGAAAGSVPGDVGFVWTDGHALVALRSAAGRVPLWWWELDGDACVGSRLSDVVAARHGRPQLDRLAGPAFLAGQAAFPDGRSVIDGVRLVPAGSTLSFGRAGQGSVVRWFDPWPDRRDAPDGRFEALAERFGAAIQAVLVDELDPIGGNLLSLSGGVDSSSLAFLARALDLPLAALSLVPDADDPVRQREMSFIEPVVADLGIAPHWARSLTMEHRLAWLADAPTAPLPVVHPVLCLLGEVRSSFDARVLVGGEFCDELSGGTFMLVDWARTASVADLVAAVRHGVVRRSWAKRWLRYRLKGVPPIGPHRELPEVFAPEPREEWAAWRELRHQEVAASSKVHAYTIELLASLDGAVAMNWEVCSALGVRRVWPFLTREVIEVVASLHPHDLIVPVHKRLSRTAFRPTVPDRWLDRSDDGSFGKGRPFAGVRFGPLPGELVGLFTGEVAAGEEPVTGEVSALAVATGLQLARSLASMPGTDPGPR